MSSNKTKVVRTTIICEMEDSWLTNRGLDTADIYPAALNAETLAENFKVNSSLFEGYPQNYELSYSYLVTIDNQGAVTSLQFLVADNAQVLSQVEECIKKLKFEPALKESKPVISYSVVSFLFNSAYE